MSPFLWVYGIIVASAFKNAGDASSLKTWEMLGPASAERGKSYDGAPSQDSGRENERSIRTESLSVSIWFGLLIPYCDPTVIFM